MKTGTILVGLAVLAALAVSGGALPGTCGNPCVINAATPGYVSPVTSIASGTAVIWASIDITHPTGEALPSGETCFLVSTSGGNPAPPVVFERDGDVLRANGVVCDSTLLLDSGELIFVYRCFLHGNMVGLLSVT